jgi:hypothetical protein
LHSNRLSPIKTGDRVAAATDLDTTQGLHIAAGTEGTVAEDRGSKLVVFFDNTAVAASMDDRDLAPVCP